MKKMKVLEMIASHVREASGVPATEAKGTKPLFFIALLALLSGQAGAAVVYEQPHNGSNTLYQSSWWDPDGSDYDIYSWDNFTLGSSQAISEFRWRGGFLYGGSWSGPIINFTVEIYPSIGGGSQPDVTHPPLVSYETGDNAGQTDAGVFGGTTMYDYHYVLPSPFQAAGETKYWVKIYAWHHGIPEWSFAAGSGGDGQYFRFLEGGPYYQAPPGNLAFSVWTADAPTYTISLSAAPANAGTTSGAGAYPVGSTATVVASPNGGYGFANWTENGAPVSTSASYSFTVTANRTLVANFVPAYTIATSAAPAIGGSTSGGGIYNTGSPVTVVATANSSFGFVNWTENGTSVSSSASYTFTASANRTLVANFALGSNTVLFDFDNAPVLTPLPIDLTVGGIAAHFSATGQGYSIQLVGTLGIAPPGFSGRCIFPSSVYPADLLVDFVQTLTDFSIMFSPQELGCDSSATMRVTAYLNGTFVGTNTGVAFPPGTWPSGTLSITVPAGFNSVVVHYDSGPPTCADYGVIFLADNMIVTRACVAASIAADPLPTSACTRGTAVFSVTAAGTAPSTYQWEREITPNSNNFVPLVDGSTASWDGGGVGVGAIVSGSSTAAFTIAADTAHGNSLSAAHAIRYRCTVTNACGSATSTPAALTVFATGTGDANNDGLTDGNDVQALLNFVIAGGMPSAGLCACDFTSDGLVDVADVPGFVNLLLGR